MTRPVLATFLVCFLTTLTVLAGNNTCITGDRFEALLASQDIPLQTRLTSVINENEDSFLSKQYGKITCISPSSCLAKYLHPSVLHSRLHVPMLLFPFGFNLSQKIATEKAFTEMISVIEGPPGTGKTQTILNIIANAIINKKTVAVVSNNNSATANVLEKLQKYGVDFIAAYLGNKENKENFFAEQTQTYPDFTKWQMDATRYNDIEKSLGASGNRLKEMLKITGYSFTKEPKSFHNESLVKNIRFLLFENRSASFALNSIMAFSLYLFIALSN